jgi:hypothetical protein
MSQASKFWRAYALVPTADLVKALEMSVDLEKDQDWAAETTMWAFPDGSGIVVNSYQEVSCFEKGDSK